jgi:hypothetical protein
MLWITVMAYFEQNLTHITHLHNKPKASVRAGVFMRTGPREEEEEEEERRRRRTHNTS